MAKANKSVQRVVSEMEEILGRCPPTVLKDKGVQRALREAERELNKAERVFRSYKDVSLFSSADFFADIIKTGG